VSFLKNLFGRSKEAPRAEAPAACQHVSLIPRWDSVADMGKPDRASHFVCEACGEKFGREVGLKAQGPQGDEMFQRPS
jgi:hypothetical protein